MAGERKAERRIEEPVRIDAPAERVHAVMGRPEEAPKWLPGCTRVERLGEEPPRFREWRRFAGHEASAVITVRRHGAEAGGALVHEAEANDGCNRVVYRYEVRPVGADACDVSCVGWAEPLNLLGRLTAGLMMRMCAKADAGALARLRDAIAAGTVGGGATEASA